MKPLVVTALCHAVLAVQLAAAQTAAVTPPRTVRAQPKTTTAIANAATPATVTILSIGANGDTLGQGSGFIVASNGMVITNWHVLRGATRAVVILSSREQFDRVTFVDGDSLADLAIIRIPGFDLPTVPTRSSLPAVGERVIAIGSPLGLSSSVTEGIVSAQRLVAGKVLVQISAAISPGSSGGAVLDGSGNVFAVSTAYLDGGQQLNFAVPVRYALGLLQTSQADRQLSEVFGSEEDGPSPTSARVAVAAPKRASHYRSDMSGTYFYEQDWYVNDTLRMKETGYLFFESDSRVGAMVWSIKRGEDLPATSGNSWVSTLRTDAAGQIALDAGGSVYDGFQTDTGFVATNRDETDPQRIFTLKMTASRATIPLTKEYGLYHLSIRTRYTIDKDYVASVDWVGTAAFAFTRDSVLVDFYLLNDKGGTTGFSARGRANADGSFDLNTPNGGQRLQGYIRAGILTAEFTDRRDGNAVYKGQLAGQRY